MPLTSIFYLFPALRLQLSPQNHHARKGFIDRTAGKPSKALIGPKPAVYEDQAGRLALVPDYSSTSSAGDTPTSRMLQA